MIKVLAEKHLYQISVFLAGVIGLTFYDPEKTPLDIADDTQALLIRTVTMINPQTFPKFPESLSFIASGSAGTDHVDENYLKEQGITFAHAGGCNARSVAEYVAISLLLWAEEFNEKLPDHKVGIIGAGHTGGAVQQLLQKLGIQTVAYDPPKAERDTNFRSVTLDEVLACDILTFHTPLTQSVPHPTYHWLDEEKLSSRSYKLVINASRGGVINEQAIINAFDAGSVENFILDVWENEPDFNDEAARRAFIKTPHIAGYSVQAKQRASKMIVEAMARHFSIDSAIPDVSSKGKTQQAPPHINSQKQQPTPDTFWSLTDALTHYHPINDYETRFKMLIGRSAESKREGFSQIRTGHPLRQEFSYLGISEDLRKKFAALKALATS
jgi:erythronate-4-phosphate dehydrogenase